MNLRMVTVLLVPGLLLGGLLVLLAGCEGCGNDAATSTTGSASTGTETTGGAATETEAASADSDLQAVPGAPPTLGLTVEPGFDGAASLVVENRGSEPVELSSTLVLEREEDGAFVPVSGIAGLALRFDCEPPPRCLTLIPGAALHPPPWNGMLGDAQCICTRCGDAPTGTYRFVVATCGAGHRVTSPAFTR
ncbi:MAG: hypothetical protein JRH11_07555 [Deltaproteobacteria bacterium]|nr:hypothetical protein [Deltaproteobacteria bacterium]